MMRAHPTHVMLETMTFPKRSWSRPIRLTTVVFSYGAKLVGRRYKWNASKVTWKGVTV